MAKFLSQFHATQDELAQFVRDLLEKYDVYATAVHYPYQTEAVSRDNVTQIFMLPSVSTIVFTESPAILVANHEGELLDKNPGSLMLDIGRLKGRCLQESTLGTMAASPLWKKINAFLKSRTIAGAIGTHDTTGTSTFYHDHRLSAGAIALSEQGTELRQYAQLPVVFRPNDKAVKRK